MRPITKITLFGLRLGLIALVCYWILIFVGTHLPKPPDVVPRLNDKVKHFSAYFVLGGLLCYVTTSTKLIRRFSTIALIGIAYGAVDEMTQMLVPRRFADFWDFAADTAGILCAIAVYAVARKYYRSRLYAIRVASGKPNLCDVPESFQLNGQALDRNDQMIP